MRNVQCLQFDNAIPQSRANLIDVSYVHHRKYKLLSRKRRQSGLAGSKKCDQLGYIHLNFHPNTRGVSFGDVRQIAEQKLPDICNTAMISVQEIPIANQVIQRHGLSHFRKGVNLDDLLAAMPEDERPSRSYHKPKILEKLRIFRFYSSLKTDINESLPLSSLKRNKNVWIPRREARRILKDRADELLPITEVDDIDGVQFPHQPRTTSTDVLEASLSDAQLGVPALARIPIADSERFVDSEGNPVQITLCGSRTYEDIRYMVDDIYSACQYDHVNMPNLSGIDIEEVTVNGQASRVVNFRNALRMFAHFDRNGSSFAMTVMDWCARVVHSVQYGDAEAPRPERMAAYMRTVAGRTCPNPMAECSSKMVYLEMMGDVATLGDSWPELTAFVSEGADAAEYKVVKPGEGSGHRFGDNARAIKAVYPRAEPECYDFRPTMLDKKQRVKVEKAFAIAFADGAIPPNPSRRFSGDTETFVLHKDQLPRAWKFMQSEVSSLEHDVTRTIDDVRVSDLKHKLEIAHLNATLNQYKLAVHTLPPAARDRFNAVLRSCSDDVTSQK